MSSVKSFLLQILPQHVVQRLAARVYSSLYALMKKANASRFITFSGSFIIRKIIGIEELLLTNPSALRIIKEFKADLYFSHPIYYPDKTEQQPVISKTQTKYVISLESARIIGASNLIILDSDLVLYDYLFQWNDTNIRYTDNAAKYRPASEILIRSGNALEIIPAGIHLAGNFSFNYYHFLYEFIARLSYINNAGIDKTVPLLIDEVCLRIPQFREILDTFNIDQRAFISLKQNATYEINELYFASCPNHIVPDYFNYNIVKASDTLFDLYSYHYMKAVFDGMVSQKIFPKKIYLSRRNASHRRKFNEDEVLEFLTGMGFKEIFPEQYSVAEQMTMFREAEIIIGGSGAAFSNLITCTNATTAICFVNFSFDYAYFSTIAALSRVRMLYLSDDTLEKVKDPDIQSSFNVNVKILQSLLSEHHI